MMTPLKKHLTLFGILILLSQCGGGGSDLVAGDTFCMDLDGDSFTALYMLEESDNPNELPIISCSTSSDCNDQSADSFPGAVEVADNSEDENCDGEVYLSSSGTGTGTTTGGPTVSCTDGSATTIYYLDNDGDGYGLTDSTQEACSLPTGYAEGYGDCDDEDANIFPGTGCEENGSGSGGSGSGSGSSCADSDKQTYYYDADGDGYYDLNTSESACEKPGDNYYLATESESDCDDDNAYANPGMAGLDYGVLIYQAEKATSQVTNSGRSSNFMLVQKRGSRLPEPTMGIGTIEDGFLGVDNDCDGQVDEDSTTSNIPEEYGNAGVFYDTCDGEGQALYFADADSDGFGDAHSTSRLMCRDEAGEGFSTNNDDCDDSSDQIHPDIEHDYRNNQGQLYVHEGIDNDCDGETDEDGDNIVSSSYVYSIAWNGHEFQNLNSSLDVSTLNRDHEAMGSHFTSDFNVRSTTNEGHSLESKYRHEGRVLYTSARSDGAAYSYKYYYTVMRMNSQYADFWYNTMQIDLVNGSSSITFKNGEREQIDKTCDYSTNRCTGSFTIHVTDPDENENNFDESFYAGRKASIFLRGYEFNHKGSFRYMKDQHVEVWLQNETIAEDGSLQVNFEFDINGGIVDGIEAKIPFTVMLYDAKKLDVLEFGRSENNMDYRNEQFAMTQSKDFTSELLDFQAPAPFSCDSANDCAGETHTYGSVIRSWGFDLDETFRLNHIKAMSFLKKFDAHASEDAIVLKTSGIAKHESRHQKAPNEMKSRVFVCSSSNVCSMKFMVESCDVSDQRGGLGLSILGQSGTCSSTNMEGGEFNF